MSVLSNQNAREIHALQDRNAALEKKVAGLEATVKKIADENAGLHKRVRELGTALLERPIPDVLPPAEFPDAPWAKTDPPQHPEGIEPGLLIAAMALDARLAL